MGSYNSIYKKSRLTEFTKTFVCTAIGCFCLFFLFLVDDTRNEYSYYYTAFGSLFTLHFVLTSLGRFFILTLVKKQIQNKQGFELSSLGRFEFKNVAEPIEVFALSGYGLQIPEYSDGNGKFKELKTVKSIAVLPFVNMSNDAEQEYFSDGIAEEVINSLAHLNNLKVAGRTSSFQFKGKNADIRVRVQKLW